MTDPKEIPHLIKLLDDDSPEIKEKIIKELIAFGPILEGELKKLPGPVNSVQKEHINRILDGQKKIWLRKVWPSWFRLKDDYQKLEKALSILSKFLTEQDSDVHLEDLLDGLAAGYRMKFDVNDARQLALFLFKEKGLKGNAKDYYNPQNSNLAYVITQKKGIPISLTGIYMLVGYRLGIKVDGCAFPGHFLAKIDWNERQVFVDCFNAGQVIEKKNILNAPKYNHKEVASVLSEPCDSALMIKRFLANLIRAFQIEEDSANNELMIELFKDLDDRLLRKKMGDLTPEDIIADIKPQFQPGQVIRHKRYGYRGVIVSSDSNCQATDSWYYGNQTQPDPQQPWYHVLMHGADQVTYVAQINLIQDDSNDKIDHPLLFCFFTQSVDGKYIRNDNEWPDTDF